MELHRQPLIWLVLTSLYPSLGRWSCPFSMAGVCLCGWCGGRAVRKSFSREVRDDGILDSLRPEVGPSGDDMSCLRKEEHPCHRKHSGRSQAATGSSAFGAGADLAGRPLPTLDCMGLRHWEAKGLEPGYSSVTCSCLCSRTCSGLWPLLGPP